MSASLLQILVTVATFALGMLVGHVVACRHVARSEREEWIKGRDAAQKVMEGIATVWLARYPTSTGARKMARALGVTVPPLPRVRRVATMNVNGWGQALGSEKNITTTADTGTVPAFSRPDLIGRYLPPDAGEGAE